MRVQFDNRKRVIFLGALYQLGSVIVIALMLLLLFDNINHAKASANWPHVMGIVTSGINSQQAYDQSKIGRTWYEYEVDGKVYRCDRVSFFESGEIYNRAQGEVVKVFYNPKDLQDACLVNGVTKIATWRFYFFSFAFLWGFGIAARMVYVLLFVNLNKQANPTAVEKLAAINVASGLSSL